MRFRPADAVFALLWSFACIGIARPFLARLPREVANHWTLTGKPNGSARQGPALALGPCVLLAVAGFTMLVGDDSRGVSPLSLVTAGLVLGSQIGLITANRDVPTWRQARLPGWAILLPLAAAAAVGGVGTGLEAVLL